MTLAEDKAKARALAFARRKAAQAAAGPDAHTLLAEVVAEHRGKPLSGYMPIRTEIDPLPVMAEAAEHGPVGVPVIEGKGLPLTFRSWTPHCTLVEGPFGAMIPASGEPVVPEVLIVPLVAFDRAGGRLGYGGGFYDRTLAGLRAAGPVTAIGFAFAAQEDEGLPREETDQPLDLIVTEAEIIAPPKDWS
ncbi:5-formyltetrahydrofolate cyclo-ligase [Tranquillimonas alkanivorans]|uniref:5-formyltetrahydrofolate cyclo-ligase n=1 Tax=Tranquillimonas alkanivorans TaxID=441119 RepID=A0A1I5N2W8_9RHOB|nr:5-formyltetrahydrofolate cyclo-ligase [Tranquillimonas alkanivorans]SFP16064.1 5-formyltetrahydrofolate cyclo-ligase [Tranquillimonas alkanivorans]